MRQRLLDHRRSVSGVSAIASSLMARATKPWAFEAIRT